jgi:hypothetical protein
MILVPINMYLKRIHILMLVGGVFYKNVTWLSWLMLLFNLLYNGHFPYIVSVNSLEEVTINVNLYVSPSSYIQFYSIYIEDLFLINSLTSMMLLFS